MSNGTEILVLLAPKVKGEAERPWRGSLHNGLKGLNCLCYVACGGKS